MAHIVADRVGEYSPTTGTVTYNLSGTALAGHRIFDAVCASSDTVCYCAVMGNDFEVGVGTFTDAATDTLARTTILASTNSNNAVDWAAGNKEITLVVPAIRVGFAGDGSAASPSHSFYDDTDSGWYRIGANNVGLSLGGTARINITTTAYSPFTADGMSLGTSSLPWSDADFANGAVIRFNNAYTLTHSSGLMTMSGALTIGGALSQTFGGGAVSQELFRFSNSNSTTATVNFSFFGGPVSAGRCGVLSWVDHTDGASGYVVLSSHSDSTEVRIGIGAQVLVGGATGGFKGTGTVNAKAVYDDNVILTDLVQEWAESGKVDVAKWDATVPDRVTPEKVVPARVERVPVMETVIEDVQSLVPVDGGYRSVVERKPIERQMQVWTPIFDERGNGIDALLEDQFDEVVIPEERIPETVERREHYAARIFQGLLKEGLDPKNPESFVAKVAADKALPGMPRADEWEHAKFSLGEMQTRTVLATEIVVQAMAGLLRRVQALEGKQR